MRRRTKVLALARSLTLLASVGVPCLAQAADLLPPPPMPEPLPEPEVFAGGWYLRVDGGYAFADLLQERSCPRFKCDCYIGYAQRKDLPFQAVFGEGVLARIVTV